MRNKLGQFGLIIAGVLIGVAISLNFSAVAQRESASRAQLPLPIEELRAFTEVFGKVKQDYVEPVEDKKLITEAINGMLTGLDPHSAYLDQEAFREMQVGTQGEFGGLGIEVGMEDGFVKVISPIDDTPASRAGVMAGDLIVKLDDSSVKGMTLNDAVNFARPILREFRGAPEPQAGNGRPRQRSCRARPPLARPEPAARSRPAAIRCRFAGPRNRRQQRF